jgi:hypothetical protein
MPLANFLIIFPGLAILVVVGGIFVAHWAVKDDG